MERYAFALLAALAALLLRHVLSPVLGVHLPYITLWPAVAFSAWYCGLGPAVIAVLVDLAGVWFWFLPRSQMFALESPITGVPAIVGFLAVSVLIIVMGELNRRARNRERRLMAETAEATAKFRTVFEQSSVFAGIMNLEGIVVDANRMCLEVCGYRAEDVLGRLFWETGWWRADKEVQDKIRAGTMRAAKGEVYREELPYVWADGTNRIVDFGMYPIRDADGEIIFLHPTGTDITDRKLAEDNLRKLKDQLEVEVGIRTQELEDRNSDVLGQTELLRVLSRRLMEVQDAERRHIARELHDSAGQLLSVLSINLSTVAHQVRSSAPEAAETADECHRIVQQMSQEIRTMSYLLHPPLLEEIGLAAALDWYVRGLTERSGLDINLSIPHGLARLQGELELVVFRVVQECLTNIHRHSGSKTASIRLSMQGEILRVEVKDQGKGISPEKLSQIQAHGSGVGIQGMRERLQPYQGKMQIESNDSGTTISFTFEVPRIQSSTESSKAQAVSSVRQRR
jgi:PAS domain S-box-containing protein